MNRWKPYTVTEGDLKIFEMAEDDPNIFTDWYLRGPNTGTWATPISDDSRNIARYAQLLKLWKNGGREETFDYEWENGLHTVRVSFKVASADPFFHIEHGFLLNDKQKEVHQAKQDTVVVMGGFGSGKTIIGAVSGLIHCATKSGFLMLVLAPLSDQSKEVFDKINDLVAGTRYQERFMRRPSREKPHPALFIANSLVGESRIDFRSILDDPGKVLNLERDMAMIDQAEQLPDIVETRRAVSTRLRGYHQGRERLGKTLYIANPYENPEIWDLYDEAEDDPEHVAAFQFSSYDNTSGLSEKQLGRFVRDVGKTDADVKVFIEGSRPTGEGKHFPGSSIEKCRSEMLNQRMATGLKEGLPGYIRVELPRIGVQEWHIPYEENHFYLVIADPGWSNPPLRNSPVIMVWDITDFPEIPAHLVAFKWVFGNGSPIPWMQQFYDYVHEYKAIGRCAYDSTGWQSGYETWVDIFEKNLRSEGMSLNASSKFAALNAGKILMAKGLLQFPDIPGIILQLAKYDLPDEKMRQDIVMAMILTATWLERVYYMKIRDYGQNNRPVQRPKVIERHRAFRRG